MKKILFIFGTRPEAIKLLPVFREMRANFPSLHPVICVTAQHRNLLDQVMETFQIHPDHDLNIMTANQTLSQVTSRICAVLESVFREEDPSLVVVQGDTNSAFCGALSAFYHRVPVAHVEAGLRSGNLHEPYPEEMNRILISKLAALHFPPTQQAKNYLLQEGISPDQIIVTGNTGIDSLRFVTDGLGSGTIPQPNWQFIRKDCHLIVTTAHRRENFGAGFLEICQALRTLADRSDTEIAFPVHPNPSVQSAFRTQLAGHANIHLLPPLDYIPFVDLMRKSHLLITDSGGIQEEGPSLGKPTLVLRDTTERPEAVAEGIVRLVGTVSQRIIDEAISLLDDSAEYNRRARVSNIYGDGKASQRICHAIMSFLAD